MTPSFQAYLLALVANQRERAEAMRALALERGLPTAAFDELLLSSIALQREIAGEAVALMPPDWAAKRLV